MLSLNGIKYCIGRSIFAFGWILWLPLVSGPGIIVPANYSKEFPPLPSSSPTGRLEIKVSLMLVNILGINEVLGELQFACFFRVYWNDSRVPPLHSDMPIAVMSQTERARIWRPDIVTENVRGVERNGIIKPTIFNGRYTTGTSQTFIYSSYIAIRIGCQFHYAGYPMDVQACIIHIGTMGLTTAEVNLGWHEENGYKMNRLRFLKFQDLFRAKVCENMHQNVRKSTFGEHPQKTLIVYLERNYKSSLLQLYLPSVVFVIIAWLSVLVPPTMLRTRLLLNSTNLLTIISMFLSISKTESSRVPKVSYVTALSLWMFVCVGFCFSSVLLVILDIRLVVILSVPGRRLQVLRSLFRLRDPDPVHVSAPVPVPIIRQDHFQTPEIVPEIIPESDEDGDVFLDATDMSPTDSTLKIAESDLQSRVAEKRLEWLSKTAGFEQFYLYLYPLLFTLFAVGYFCYYMWLRSEDRHRMIDDTGGAGAKYPGCWCLPDDTHPKCMRPADYARI